MNVSRNYLNKPHRIYWGGGGAKILKWSDERGRISWGWGGGESPVTTTWANSSTFLKIISCPTKYEFAPQMPSPNSEAWRRRKFFVRRQSDSSLIVGCIIDPRPGLRALSMDPFVPCVTHWCTIYPALHVVLLRPRVER
jgi:hypothetical protein